MLRITTVREDDKNVRFRLCGQFTAEYVPELERALAGEADIHSIALDLANVTFVDREAMMFLCGARARQIAVENIPSYVRRWIQQENRCGSTEDTTSKSESSRS